MSCKSLSAHSTCGCWLTDMCHARVGCSNDKVVCKLHQLLLRHKGTHSVPVWCICCHRKHRLCISQMQRDRQVVPNKHLDDTPCPVCCTCNSVLLCRLYYWGGALPQLGASCRNHKQGRCSCLNIISFDPCVALHNGFDSTEHLVTDCLTYHKQGFRRHLDPSSSSLASCSCACCLLTHH
jgi:hypothetical protein